MKLLAIGDMHLGKRPTRLPDSSPAASLGPASALERIVERAIEREADVVVFAGDVVERDDDFFEAYRTLHAAVKKLADEGILVFGVAGNHDVKVLPRLAAEIDGFRLLGRGGVWERERIEIGSERVMLWGWSYPAPRVTSSPLAGGLPELPSGLNIGVLHCDRDQHGSPYAPVSSYELDTSGMDAWLLGHIHKPDALTAERCSGYLGSGTATDPGEAGPRGPWEITIEGGRINDVRQWVLAPLRWEALDVDLTGISEPEHGQERLLDSLRALDAELSALPDPPRAVGLRVKLVGRCDLGEAVLSILGREDEGHVHSGEGKTDYFVERVRPATEPELSLQELAKRDDPAGLLARRLLLLDGTPEDRRRQMMLDEARAALNLRLRDSRWRPLGLKEVDEEAAAEWLREAGTRLLERLLSQREEAA